MFNKLKYLSVVDTDGTLHYINPAHIVEFSGLPDRDLLKVCLSNASFFVKLVDAADDNRPVTVAEWVQLFNEAISSL